MASSITIKVAGYTSTITLKATDEQVGNVIKWAMADKATPPPDGLTPQQLNQYWLDAAAQEIVDYVRGQARKNRYRELAKEEEALEDQADADTKL